MPKWLQKQKRVEDLEVASPVQRVAMRKRRDVIETSSETEDVSLFASLAIIPMAEELTDVGIQDTTEELPEDENPTGDATDTSSTDIFSIEPSKTDNLELFGVGEIPQEQANVEEVFVTENEEELITSKITEEPVEEEFELQQEYPTIRQSHDVLQMVKEAQQLLSKPIRWNSDEISIKYDKGVELVHVCEDGTILFPNNLVYQGGISYGWDKNFEVKVPKGDSIELDLGICIAMPTGYGIEITGAEDILDKYGMKLKEGQSVLSPLDAATPIIVQLEACTNTSYVAKYKSILKGRLVELPVGGFSKF